MNEIEKMKLDIENLQETLGTLISWLQLTLGVQNVHILLDMINADKKDDLP